MHQNASNHLITFKNSKFRSDDK